MSACFEPAGPLRGALRPPPDKSISHRAALIAAMAEGRSLVLNYLDSADTRSTLAAISLLGASIEEEETRNGGLELAIRGVGLRRPADGQIDVGNAGTLLRLLPGWLAGGEGGHWTLDGDESIRRRPVDRVAEPLRRMGARVECRDGRLPPLRVEGARLRGIRYQLPAASAQVKSCVLLAGLLARGRTTVVEPAQSRDHTERMLEAVGVEVDVLGTQITVQRPVALEPLQMAVPGDFSSAAFHIVAALLVQGSEVTVERIGLNPTRTGLLDVLVRMGAELDVSEESVQGREPVGRAVARHAELRATEIAGDEIPLAIDELPLVALAACFAEGETVIRDAEELRRKESDRIATVAESLNALGGNVEPTPDGMVISGSGGLRGGRIDAHGDHRIAMLGAIAGLASREGVEVDGMNAAAVSYPRFEADLASLQAR